jgi:8-oxo-dGTP pyrophosphatase MutT (NUDIX family)
MSKTLTSGLFIIKKNKKLLICHPTKRKANEYSIPKGRVEDDEIFLEAAFRETYEESNLDLNGSTDFTIYPLNSVEYKNKKKILYPFLMLENNNSKFDWDSVELKCNSNVPKKIGGFPEMDGYRWVTLDEAEELIHEAQVKCLPKIKEILER